MIRETLSLAPRRRRLLGGAGPHRASDHARGVFVVALPWGCIGGEAVRAAVLVIMRLVACAVPLFLVMYVTQLADLANAFCKVLHVPYKYAFTFTSAVRFIPVFMNDMAGIMEAQTARGVEFDVGLARKLRLMVSFVRAPSGVVGAQDGLCRHRRAGTRVRTAHAGERVQGVSVLGARRGGVRGVVYGAADGDRRVLEAVQAKPPSCFFAVCA